MKKKIVIKAHFTCEKCRTTAMEITASLQGIEKLSIIGAERDRLEIVGEDVDLMGLIKKLKKKIGHAEIVTVEDVKKEEPKKPEQKKPEEKPEHRLCWCPPPCSGGGYPYSHCSKVVVYDDNPNACVIV